MSSLTELRRRHWDLFQLGAEGVCHPRVIQTEEGVKIWTILGSLLFCPRRTGANCCGNGRDAPVCEQKITRVTLSD